MRLARTRGASSKLNWLAQIEGGRDLPRLRDILEGKDVAGDEAYDDQL